MTHVLYLLATSRSESLNQGLGPRRQSCPALPWLPAPPSLTPPGSRRSRRRSRCCRTGPRSSKACKCMNPTEPSHQQDPGEKHLQGWEIWSLPSMAESLGIWHYDNRPCGVSYLLSQSSWMQYQAISGNIRKYLEILLKFMTGLGQLCAVPGMCCYNITI